MDTVTRGDQRVMENTAAELVQYEDLSATDRTLHMLEYERSKFRFFSNITEEILFEYTQKPPMLTFSLCGARRLELEEAIVDPYGGERLRDQIGPKELSELLHHTTPEDPVVEYDCEARLDGKLQPVHIIARAMWSSDETPQYTGAIGKVIERRE